MVQVVHRLRVSPDIDHGRYSPLIHIHHVKRDIHGNGIAIKVYGEMKIAGKEVVYARELKLNTLQVLLLTVEQGAHNIIVPSKWIYHKGEYDNYASVDVFCITGGYEMLRDSRIATPAVPEVLPEDGSIWLNFIALGE